MMLIDVFRDAQHVLLDFDGPVCAIYGGTSDRAVADYLRRLIKGAGREIPVKVRSTRDPLEVLRFSARLGRDCVREVEAAFVTAEVDAAGSASATPGARDAMRALVSSGHTITVVSNNSAEAVYAYLARADLGSLVVGVVGRIPNNPSLMKPNPHLLEVAMADLHTSPSKCVMIGDSATDITAAHAAGVKSIGYANRASKVDLLTRMSPDAVVESMGAIAEAVARRPDAD